jgi:hypothetical protein
MPSRPPSSSSGAHASRRSRARDVRDARLSPSVSSPAPPGRDLIEELWPGWARVCWIVLALAPAESAHLRIGEGDLGVGRELQPEADEDGDLRV